MEAVVNWESIPGFIYADMHRYLQNLMSINEDEKLQTAKRDSGHVRRKGKISHCVEMDCLSIFPSPAELCALQTEGNISFETSFGMPKSKACYCWLQWTDPNNILQRRVFLNEIKGAWKRDQLGHTDLAGACCVYLTLARIVNILPTPLFLDQDLDLI